MGLNGCLRVRSLNCGRRCGLGLRLRLDGFVLLLASRHRRLLAKCDGRPGGLLRARRIRLGLSDQSRGSNILVPTWSGMGQDVARPRSAPRAQPVAKSSKATLVDPQGIRNPEQPPPGCVVLAS